MPIINGGAGTDQHPTQALLDIYTINRTFQFQPSADFQREGYADLSRKYPELKPGIDHKTYAFCGDLGRGRTVRSLAELLTIYEGTRMIFISPEHEKLRLGDDLRGKLLSAGIEFHEVNSLDATVGGKPLLSQVDCLYMTRVQAEHDNEADRRAFAEIDFSHFHLSSERVQQMKTSAAILHPFPRDSVAGEIPTEIDADPRTMYFRQARNGMWIRAALLVHLFDVADDLSMSYRDIFHTNPEDAL